VQDNPVHQISVDLSLSTNHMRAFSETRHAETGFEVGVFLVLLCLFGPSDVLALILVIRRFRIHLLGKTTNHLSRLQWCPVRPPDCTLFNYGFLSLNFVNSAKIKRAVTTAARVLCRRRCLPSRRILIIVSLLLPRLPLTPVKFTLLAKRFACDL